MYIKVRPPTSGKKWRCAKWRKTKNFFNQSTQKLSSEKPRYVVRGNQKPFQLTQQLLTD